MFRKISTDVLDGVFHNSGCCETGLPTVCIVSRGKITLSLKHREEFRMSLCVLLRREYS
jgi:hypothetical protein